MNVGAVSAVEPAAKFDEVVGLQGVLRVHLRVGPLREKLFKHENSDYVPVRSKREERNGNNVRVKKLRHTTSLDHQIRSNDGSQDGSC